MKARDIIPGWPRPRTTTSADKWFWVPRWRLWSDEECENIRYHQQQAAMIKAHIEQPLDEMMFHHNPLGNFRSNKLGPVLKRAGFVR